MKSNMDGSGFEKLLEGLKNPFGIAVKSIGDGKLLMWTNSGTGQVGFLNLNDPKSKDRNSLPQALKLRGLTVAETFTCVATNSSIYVALASKAPDYKNPAYRSSEPINHLFTPSFKYDFDRNNDCEGKVSSCETICLLTPDNSRCFPKK